jgi:hypothetical protein
MLLNDVVEELGTPDDFIGHVGGDDFIIVTQKDLVKPLKVELEKRFEEGVGPLRLHGTHAGIPGHYG